MFWITHPILGKIVVILLKWFTIQAPFYSFNFNFVFLKQFALVFNVSCFSGKLWISCISKQKLQTSVVIEFSWKNNPQSQAHSGKQGFLNMRYDSEESRKILEVQSICKTVFWSRHIERFIRDLDKLTFDWSFYQRDFQNWTCYFLVPACIYLVKFGYAKNC